MADTTTSPALGTQTTGETNLSTWAGPYITDMLGKAQALSELPFQPYGGQLTAGTAPLQSQAFQGIAGLTVPQALDTAAQQAQQTFGLAQQYMPQVGTIQSYMNPYLEAVISPQQREATRQADIARNEMQSRLAKAGSYGGSRQAILEAEGQRNLQTLLNDITGKGYSSAWDQAQKQRMADIEAGQRGLGAQTAATQALGNIGGQQAQYGLANVAQQLAAGQAQRGIEQEGLSRAYEQFMREEQYPREQLQFQRQMISGIPGLATQSYYTSATDPFAQAAQGAQSLMSLLSALKVI